MERPTGFRPHRHVLAFLNLDPEFLGLGRHLGVPLLSPHVALLRLLVSLCDCNLEDELLLVVEEAVV